MWKLRCHSMDLQKWSQKGSIETRVPKFLQERETRCWLTQDFDMSGFPEIPKPMRDLYQNLEMSFERNARQGS